MIKLVGKNIFKINLWECKIQMKERQINDGKKFYILSLIRFHTCLITRMSVVSKKRSM